ncbi:hypothetical protein F5X96DRAFT_642644 [Biscogniauxia mediterranea]|nr:hypothetical protein F5X96DRAFT_642644 [Biscogniauxia mediterranea]
MSNLLLTSLDLLSVSSTTRSLTSSYNASIITTNHDQGRARKAQLPDRLNFYLSSSSLPSPADSVSTAYPISPPLAPLAPPPPPPPAHVWASKAMPHVATKSEGDLSGLRIGRTNAFALSSTADYHNSLLDQHRHIIGHRPSSSQDTNTPNSLRQWFPIPNGRRAGVHSSSEKTAGESRASGVTNYPRTRKRRMTMMKRKERKSQSQGQNPIQSQRPTMRDLAMSPQPVLTRQDVEEYEALPIAVRRKYFSTLERLRFAQTSDILDQTQQARRGRGPHPNWTNQRPTTSPTCWEHPALLESLSLAKLPAKIREKHLTREEQLLVAKQLRESVILDAADEAIYKIGRRASPHVYTPTLSSSTRPSSMASVPSDKQLSASEEPHDALYDSFRWLDEEDDLDLSLAIDDYHANLKEPMPLSTPDPPAPSFRRRLSISKMTFGRTSMSSSRPATKDATCSPNTQTPSVAAFSQHTRRKSRAFSLMAPKHESQTSVASFDPTAVHYQDPEARLKLRVYLASPQKFDEAVEFGFPSNDIRSAGPSRCSPDPGRGFPHAMLSPDSENFKTFLEDDQSSTYSDDASMLDPESPKTPDTPENHTQMMRPLRFPSESEEHQHRSRGSEGGYAQAPAASREFTLRMTLTRPDLRACEEQTYQGWQAGPQSGRVSQASRSQSRNEGFIPTPPARSATMESMDRIFADIDQELGQQSDSSVVKRFWNRVRRN